MGQVRRSLFRLALQLGSASLQRCILFLKRSHFPLQRGLFGKRGRIHLLQATGTFHPSVDSDSPFWRQVLSSDRVNWSQRRSPDWCYRDSSRCLEPGQLPNFTNSQGLGPEPAARLLWKSPPEQIPRVITWVILKSRAWRRSRACVFMGSGACGQAEPGRSSPRAIDKQRKVPSRAS